VENPHACGESPLDQDLESLDYTKIENFAYGDEVVLRGEPLGEVRGRIT
jgi:hypothetical protein